MKLIRASPSSLAEQVVDVVVGDFCERRPGARDLHLLHQSVEDLVQLVGSLLHPQPHQTERGTGIEDHHQDDPSSDDADVQVVFLSLVKEDRELLFSEQLGETAGGRDVAGGERGERRGIEVLGGADGGDELAVLVDEEDDLRVGLPRQALADRADLLEFLVVHHHLRLHSRGPLPELGVASADANRALQSGPGSRAARIRLHFAMLPRRTTPAGTQISRLPCRARTSVTWSAYSRSPPMGMPCAMRVTRTPSGFTRRVMYSAVASPSTVGSVATITSSTPWCRRETSSFSLS